MKNGKPSPVELSIALENDEYAYAIFSRMRPSCQQMYADRVIRAKGDEALSARMSSILAEIQRYGQKHGIGK